LAGVAYIQAIITSLLLNPIYSISPFLYCLAAVIAIVFTLRFLQAPIQIPSNRFATLEPPEVQFIEVPKTSDTPRPIPIHPHIYSNGIICLDLLSSAGWSPVQTVESVCMSIQSMLTANNRNERPPGDSDFVSYNRRRPRDINFFYDDDNV
jgi:Ubiquitin-conjugating enzyme